jgi:serine/threonine-protein kinase
VAISLQCSSCHAPLPEGVSDGLCPTCVARLLETGHRNNATRRRGKWPRRFGDYELLEKIGIGGMGVVYKARQCELDRVVALKMIRSDHFDGKREVERFRSETVAVARLDHPHIVPLYDVGERRGRHFFSMLLVESGSVMTHLPRLHKDQRKCAQIMATVARAVHYAHQHGILHRDLKPANILLDLQDQPYVSDFGLAKRVDDDAPHVTQTGAVVGTPSYMAPEQAAGKRGKGSPASDVYSLGAILYEMLTGQAPFARNPAETMRHAQEQEPRRPSAINRKVHPDLETVCLKCLEKDPARRYPTAEALALERFLRDEPIGARPIGRFGQIVKWAR